MCRTWLQMVTCLAGAFSLLTSCTAALPDGDPRERDVASARSAILSASATLQATATIFEDEAGNNGGGYSDICLGNLGSTGSTRRAYLFYRTPSIPPGSTVTRVVLTITQLRVRPAGGGPFSATLQLREVTSFWLEGTGAAAAAPCGGGTDVPGVDWAGAPTNASTDSGVETMDATDGSIITFDTDIGTDDDELITDMQSWVDGVTNRGWMLQVVEESTTNNARVLTPGTLTIEYRAPGGTTCSVDGDCASDSCVGDDGRDCATGGGVSCVCCDQATCDGVCESCSLVGSVGTCTARSGTTPCRTGSCSAGVATLSETCDGLGGSCPAVSMVDCSPFMCSGSACATMCARGSDCDTGFCVDGVCCDRACDGQCEACDVTASSGTCTPVVGSPHGDRDACAGDGSSCDGLCDGSDTTACSYPGEASECRRASCTGSTATEVAFCAGDGTCPSEVLIDCPFGCNGEVCDDTADGSIGLDGGPGSMEGGCSCRVAGRPGGSTSLLAALFVLASIRRRGRG